MFQNDEIDPAKCDYYKVATVDELPPGERLFFEINERTIALFNIGGKYFAIRDICSHDDGPLGDGDLDGYTIKCPRHGAVFDVRSGRALSMPAVVGIPAYPIRVVGEDIEVGIPRYQR